MVSGCHVRAKETSEVIDLRSTIVNCVKVLTNYVTWVAVNTVKCYNIVDAVFFLNYKLITFYARNNYSFTKLM